LQTSGTHTVVIAPRSICSVNAAQVVGFDTRVTRTNTVDGHVTLRVEYSPGPDTADAVSANCQVIRPLLHARVAPQLPVSTSKRSDGSDDVNRMRGTPAPRRFGE
jgi:hypothetical protein